ncbi:hypothetical protein FOA52_003884 [Chlamydomonas sp. UWO 241]|nr:hypothetical protein FOA52_003884 [Chlamydomonas sp. UWO 241]
MAKQDATRRAAATVLVVSIAALLMCSAARAQNIQFYQSCAGFMCPKPTVCADGTPAASSSLLQCGPGTEVVVEAGVSTTCTLCGPGRFKTLSGPAACAVCGAGNYCPGLASTKVTSCPDGSASTSVTAASVTDCACTSGYMSDTGYGPCFQHPVDFVGCYDNATTKKYVYMGYNQLNAVYKVNYDPTDVVPFQVITV